MRLLALLSCLAITLGVRVAVEVYDLENALLAQEAVEAAPGASGQDVMDATTGLAWHSAIVEMGPLKLPVVTEISGLRAGMPSTAWVLTHRAASGEVLADNVGMGDVRVGEGDVLSWRYWSLPALAAATKKAKQDAAAAAAAADAAAAAAPEAAAEAAGQGEL
jgi:hypothetical protein